MAGEVLTRMMSPDKKNFFDPSAFPLLEYDPARQAKIEPSLLIQPRPISEHCVICFFKEVIEKIVNEKNAKIAGVRVGKMGRIRSMRSCTRIGVWHSFIPESVPLWRPDLWKMRSPSGAASSSSAAAVGYFKKILRWDN